MSRPPSSPCEIHYPESDGKPMSDSTRQFDWIVLLATNLMSLFRSREDVFVCGNQFWYPCEGKPEVCMAPDVYVVFGWPKGERGSYKQWEEGGTPMTVTFEVRSPLSTDDEMTDLLLFYDKYGVEEYYLYDPDRNDLEVYLRGRHTLCRVEPADGFRSPLLGISFHLTTPEMVVRNPDGSPFVSFEQRCYEYLNGPA